jgi:hypothetical protein
MPDIEVSSERALWARLGSHHRGTEITEEFVMEAWAPTIGSPQPPTTPVYIGIERLLLSRLFSNTV